MMAESETVDQSMRKREIHQENCEHFSVRRIINRWLCLECGLEFIPKDRIRKDRKNEP